MNLKLPAVHTYLGHDQESPEVNIYFFDIFQEIANIQFDVETESLPIDLTRTEQMARDSDAYIGIYSYNNLSGAVAENGSLTSQANKIRLELDIVLRSKKPALIFYDKRFGTSLEIPPIIKSYAFDIQDLIGQGNKPKREKHTIAFREFINEVVSYIAYQNNRLNEIPIHKRVLLLLPEKASDSCSKGLTISIDVLKELNCDVQVISWPPVITPNFYTDLHKAELVIADVGSEIESTAIAAFLQGFFIPMIRLAHIDSKLTSYQEIPTNRLIKECLPNEIIEWSDESTLRTRFKHKILRLLDPMIRITTHKAATRYFLSAALRQETVFLSYTGNDRNVAKKLRLELNKKFRKVIDYRDGETMFSGQVWREQVNLMLESSAIAVPILSADFISSQNCLNELRRIMELRKRKGLVVLPVKVSNENLDLPETIAFLNYLRLWEYDDIKSLAEKLILSYSEIKSSGY